MNLNVARHFPTCGRIAVPAVRYCTTPHHCKRSDIFPHARVTLTSITTSAATAPPHPPPPPHASRPHRTHSSASTVSQSGEKSAGKWKFNFKRCRDRHCEIVTLYAWQKHLCFRKLSFNSAAKVGERAWALGVLCSVRVGPCVFRHATHIFAFDHPRHRHWQPGDVRDTVVQRVLSVFGGPSRGNRTGVGSRNCCCTSAHLQQLGCSIACLLGFGEKRLRSPLRSSRYWSHLH